MTFEALLLLPFLVFAQPGHGRPSGTQQANQNQVSLKVRSFLNEKFIVSVDGRKQEGYASRSYTFTGLRQGRHDLVVELTSPARAVHRATVDLQSKDEEYVVQWKTSRNGTELVVAPLDVFLYGNGRSGSVHSTKPPEDITAPNRNGNYRDGYQDGYRDGWKDAVNGMIQPPDETMAPEAVAVDMVPAATPEDVALMVSQLKSESFDANRLELAQAMVTSKLLASADVKRLLGAFTYEENKLSFAKYAYTYVADPENYYQLSSAFTFSSNKTDLLNYIKQNQR